MWAVSTGNYNKARNHMSELITSIEGSVSHSSPWTQVRIYLTYTYSILLRLQEITIALPKIHYDLPEHDLTV